MKKSGYKKLTRRAFAFYVLTVIFAVIAFRWDVIIRNYTVDTGKNADFVKILLITDLHSSYYGEGEKNLISKIDKISPDVIMLGGDICDDKVPHEITWKFLENIGLRYPCYYVAGNHEYWSGEADMIKEKITSYGVKVLENEKTDIEINGSKINIYGLEDPEYYGTWDVNDKWAADLGRLNKLADKDEVNILLSHRPEPVEYYKNTDFDALLCGHAHGGQVRLPLVINGLYAPNQGVFPKYAGGEYIFEHNKMIVSRGLCLNTTPRVFNRPELVVVNVR